MNWECVTIANLIHFLGICLKGQEKATRNLSSEIWSQAKDICGVTTPNNGCYMDVNSVFPNVHLLNIKNKFTSKNSC
jgi:hypothetical protein